MEIRPAELADAAAIAAILNPIIEAGRYTALDTLVSAAQERAFLESFPQTGIFLVAAEGPAVLAFQNVEPFADYTRAYAHVGIIATYVDRITAGGESGPACSMRRSAQRPARATESSSRTSARTTLVPCERTPASDSK